MKRKKLRVIGIKFCMKISTWQYLWNKQMKMSLQTRSVVRALFAGHGHEDARRTFHNARSGRVWRHKHGRIFNQRESARLRIDCTGISSFFLTLRTTVYQSAFARIESLLLFEFVVTMSLLLISYACLE